MTVRVGLVGAGPWATMSAAPMLVGGPGTTLAAVWARRAEAATDLGARFAVPVAGSFEELLATCDAVAFAVPPAVQAELAPVAAGAGRHLLLEKPLATSVAAAEAVAAAADAAGVVTQLLLTNRWTTAVDTFLAEVGRGRPRVLTAEFVGSAALPGSPFATAWRSADAAVLDVGPHVLDLVQAAAGPAAVVHARRAGVVTTATLEHASGAVSSVTLSAATPGARGPLRCAAVTDAGRVDLADPGAEDRTVVHRRITATFAGAVAAGRSPDLDVHHGVRLQRLLADVERSTRGDER
ncbi:Gfo/Idh/MocA family protein [Blastococcus sp. SYSU D00820]